MKSLARYAVLAAALLAPALGLSQTRERAAFSQAELDQMLAPVALYPDPLLSQMLMAATYPLEVIEAARWSKANPGLQGDAAVKAATAEGWDPSVTSLVAFPQVLAWMDENLKWTSAVGDAFLAQQPQVMDTVQALRARAQDAGSLRSDDRVVVTQEGPTIVMVPADPQLVYVPYYDPLVVYGTWWWPAYPPVYWRPWPGYRPRPGFAVVWTPGIRVSTGFFFGACDWRRRQVRVVQVNNYYYNTVIVNRQITVNRAPGAWQHDPAHRRGIGYRDAAVERRFAASAPAQRQPWRAPAQTEASRAYSPPPRVQEERRGEERKKRRVEERREPRDGGSPQAPGGFASGPGGFSPGPGGFSAGPGGFSPGPGGLQPLRRERREPGSAPELRQGVAPLPPLPGALPPLPGGLPPLQPQPRRDSGASLNNVRDQHREHRARIEVRQAQSPSVIARLPARPATRAPEQGSRGDASRRHPGDRHRA